MRRYVLANYLFVAVTTEEIFPNHVEAGLLDFVDLSKEHRRFFHFLLDFMFDCFIAQSIKQEF
jgi:hypothetical protein